jgi:hypothetical protein
MKRSPLGQGLGNPLKIVVLPPHAPIRFHGNSSVHHTCEWPIQRAAAFGLEKVRFESCPTKGNPT